MNRVPDAQSNRGGCEEGEASETVTEVWKEGKKNNTVATTVRALFICSRDERFRLAAQPRRNT